MELPAEARALIESPALGHLVTLNADGTPQVSCVYLGPDVKFPPMDDPPAGFVLRITPERLGGVGAWT